MSIFSSLKKLLSGQSGTAVQVNTPRSPSCEVRPETLPSDVMRLLWFADGPLTNYRNEHHQLTASRLRAL